MKALDTITICKVGAGKSATKSHELVDGEWITTPFDAGYYVQSRPARLNGLGSLYVLLQALAAKPECFVLRGALRRGVDGNRPHVRRYHTLEPTADDPNPEPPSYEPADRRWLCVDVDDYVIPDELRAPELRSELVARVVSGLPAWLHGAGYIVQWSSSAGLDGFQLAKIHLWFWLARPVCGFSLREHFKAWNAGYNEASPGGQTRVDCALYNPVQPHYTAAPLFTGESTPDPLRRVTRAFSYHEPEREIVVNDRLVMKLGDDATPPPELLSLSAWQGKEDAAREQEEQRRRAARAAREALGTRWSNATRRERYVSAALDAAVAAVENVHGAYEWYPTLRAETFSTYQLVAAGELGEDVWRSTWEEVAARPGGIPGRKMSAKDTARLLDGAARRAEARDVSHVGSDTRGQGQLGGASGSSAGSFTERAKSWLK